MESNPGGNRGLTARSVLVMLFGILASALCVQFYEIIEASGNAIGAAGLPVAAFMVYVPLLLLAAGFAVLARVRFLTRAESLCVLFSLLIATPLVSSGFWMMLIGPLGTIPKTAYFEVYDALPEKIWPHSGNIVAHALTPENRDTLRIEGGVAWEEVEVEKDRRASIPVLSNSSPDAVSSLRIAVPVIDEGGRFDGGFAPEEPYLITVLLRPEKLGADSSYFCRVYYGDTSEFDVEVFSTREPGEVNYLHRTGFLRRGMYNLTIPPGTEGPVEIEIGLAGTGRLAVAECELLGVGALDAIYRGRRVVTEAEAAALPKPLRHELIVRPDSLFSVAGLQYAVSGFIPWGDWLRPFFSWTSFGAILLLSFIALALIMRRQWIENERYPLPMTRIPVALLGDEERDGQPAPSIWRNRLVWIGFGLSLFWCLMKGWHAYNTTVPDMRIEVDLSTYFTDASWGRMWKGEEVRNVTFTVTAILLSLAIFMELNVLFSLVLGFFLYRCQYWFGEAAGLTLQQDYPYWRQQQVGAFLAYGLLILFFTRKYLFEVGKAVFGRGRLLGKQEVLSYRGSVGLLAGCVLAMALWASWNGLAVSGMLVFFGAVLLVGLVSMKLRAECGTPLGNFAPVAMVQVIPIAGGMLLFGPKGVMFVCIASYVVFQYIFFLLPGMQLEMLELGTRFRIPSRHILGALLLGSVGGLILGGWVYLALGYGVGGDNYSQRWPYMDKTFIAQDFNQAMAEANVTLLPADSPLRAAAGGIKPTHWGYIFGAAVTAVLVALRQFFSGFWFHPIGFVIGSSTMMEYVWGSVLAAGIIRYVTLKLGGAVTVRTKLIPFFVGVFLGAIAAHLVFAVISGTLYFYHPALLRKSFGLIL